MRMTLLQHTTSVYKSSSHDVYDKPLEAFVNTRIGSTEQDRVHNESGNPVQDQQVVDSNQLDDIQTFEDNTTNERNSDSKSESDTEYSARFTSKLSPDEIKAARKENKKKVKEEKRESRKKKVSKADKKRTKKLAKAKCTR